MLTMAATSLIVGVASNWLVVWFTGILTAILITLWNIVTVSFRQAVIPEHLFGRVNSVYRFFGTGGAPIGSFLGAVIVSICMKFMDRELALRIPFFVDAACALLIFALTRKSLADSEFAAARSAE
jgi:MFS family permease